MIGNDVVDLSHALTESNWKRKGYLNKIYTESEQLLIKSASDQDLMVWLLWSMKESSYKINQRMTGVREYAPIKIECSIQKTDDNLYFGTSVYNKVAYQLKSFVCSEYIHTIALYDTNNFSEVTEILIRNYPADYIDYLKENNFIRPFEHIIKDQFGIPNLFNEFSKESKPISISHHGNFLILTFIKE